MKKDGDVGGSSTAAGVWRRRCGAEAGGPDAGAAGSAQSPFFLYVKRKLPESLLNSLLHRIYFTINVTNFDNYLHDSERRLHGIKIQSCNQ